MATGIYPSLGRLLTPGCVCVNVVHVSHIDRAFPQHLSSSRGYPEVRLKTVLQKQALTTSPGTSAAGGSFPLVLAVMTAMCFRGRQFFRKSAADMGNSRMGEDALEITKEASFTKKHALR